MVNRQQAGLAIGDLSARTGVPQATLRTWEARHGVPRPRRLPGGHRRYVESDVALVEAILRHRAAGLSLEAAISAAGRVPDTAEVSVYAGLRRRHAQLRPQVLTKSTLLALSHAIEDECCARAEHPVLFASFQHERFFRQSEARWAELARTAKSVVIFADFTEPPPVGASVLQVPVPADAPMGREWALVCDAADHPACLAGWERPGQGKIPDSKRRFETVWSVDPVIVRQAAEIGVQLVATFAPGHGQQLAQFFAETPVPASSDLRRATSLFDRMLGYLEPIQGEPWMPRQGRVGGARP